MKFDLAKNLKLAKGIITANSPALLTAAAITGIVVTGITAAKGGFKARGILDEAQEAKGEEPLTTQEKVSLTWLCYVPATLAGASSIASCFGVHLIHTKRHAALAGLYAVTTSKLDDYKDLAEEALTKKKAQAIQDRLLQKSADDSPFEISEVTILPEGSELCYDDFSGRWFTGSLHKIQQAEIATNQALLDDGSVTLNTFYDHLGLTPIPLGEDLGWASNWLKAGRIELMHASVVSSEGKPALAYSFRTEPKPHLGIL